MLFMPCTISESLDQIHLLLASQTNSLHQAVLHANMTQCPGV